MRFNMQRKKNSFLFCYFLEVYLTIGNLFQEPSGSQKIVAICIWDFRDFFYSCCFPQTLRVGKARLFWAKQVVFVKNKEYIKS